MITEALPLIIRMRDLVAWTGQNRWRLRRAFQRRGLLKRREGGYQHEFNTETLRREWPDLIVGIEARMARGEIKALQNAEAE